MSFEFERGPNYSEKEQRRLTRRLLAREILVLSEQTSNPVIKKLAEKALAILVMKERIESQAEGASKPEESDRVVPHIEETIPIESHGLRQPDNVGGADASGGIITGSSGRQFGIFFAVERKAEEQFSDPKTGFFLNKGDFYIELHIPPVNPDDRVIGQVGPSLESLAGYLDEKELSPKYIMGITYERLASVSEKWGFTVANPDLPAEVSDAVERFSRAAVREGLKDQPLGQLQLAYQDGKSFLDRFSPHRPAPK